MKNQPYLGPESQPNKVQNEADKLMPDWIEWQTEELNSDDTVLAHPDGAVAIIEIAGEDMTIVWSKKITNEEIKAVIKKLAETGYPNLSFTRLGEERGMKALKYWVKEKGFTVLRDPLIGINRHFTFSDVKVDGEDLESED